MRQGYKVIYIDRNFLDPKYPNKPSDGDSFYTYGWFALCARQFKKFNPEIDVECWKADSRIKRDYEKIVSGVHFKIFPSLYIPKLGDYSRRLLLDLKKEVTSGSRVVVNVSSFDHLLFYSIAKLCKNVPFVSQNHGEGTARYDFKARNGLSALKALIEMPLQNAAFRNLDLVYILDKRLEQYFPDWFDKERIKVRTTGVDPEVFPNVPKAEARHMLGLSEQKFYILYIGKLNRTKRPEMLIQAYVKLREEYSDIELIIGGCQRDEEYYSLANESGAILVEGPILQTNIYKYLNASDVYVLASYSMNHTHGGIGMLPVQALFCDTPVVGESVHNLPEEIRDRCGIYTKNISELSAAIRSIYQKQNKFLNTREKAIKYYSWENISLQTNLDYEALIKEYY
jgi:glycosyltransferase involved in cell wall biosynthesis